MEIGIFYDNVKEAYKDIEDDIILLGMVKELGYSYIDINLDELTKKSADFFIRAHELSVGFSVYAFADENCILRDGKNAEDLLPFLAEHGITNLMMVCMPEAQCLKYDEDVRCRMVSSLSLLCAAAKEYGITILMEDFDNDNIPCGNSEDMLYFAGKIPDLRFTFDTGNFAWFGENVSECYDKLKSKTAHVHLKDRVSPDDLRVTVTGEGGLPIAEIIGRLASDGYDKKLSVEMYGAAGSPQSLKSALAFVSREITGKV